MSQRNAEQVSEAILKAVLRKNIDEQVIGDVSAQELVGLVANNFSSCPACGAEPWTNIDCRVCDLMGAFESEPRVDLIAAERDCFSLRPASQDCCGDGHYACAKCARKIRCEEMGI